MSLANILVIDNHSLLNQLVEIAKYQQIINEAAEKYALQPSIMAALGSRESQWGLALKPKGPGGTGDFKKRRFPTPYRSGPLPPDGGGFGRGLMQIDFDAHEFARGNKWPDPRENIFYGAKVLADCLKIIRRKEVRELDNSQILRVALAGYNAGPGRALRAIREQRDVDYYTTGRDYSASVLNLAGWFQAQGWA